MAPANYDGGLPSEILELYSREAFDRARRKRSKRLPPLTRFRRVAYEPPLTAQRLMPTYYNEVYPKGILLNSSASAVLRRHASFLAWTTWSLGRSLPMFGPVGTSFSVGWGSLVFKETTTFLVHRTSHENLVRSSSSKDHLTSFPQGCLGWLFRRSGLLVAMLSRRGLPGDFLVSGCGRITTLPGRPTKKNSTKSYDTGVWRPYP